MIDPNTEKLTAVLTYGLQQIRPTITRYNSNSLRGGSYLNIQQMGQSYSIPVQDFSVTRTDMGRFR